MPTVSVIKTQPGFTLQKKQGIVFSGVPALKKLPWDSVIAKNALVSRAFIETVGYYTWGILLSRNKFEALERFLDIGMWYATILLVPLLSRKVAGHFTKAFLKPMGIKNNSPLSVPFELIERLNLNNSSKLKSLASYLKIKNTPSKSQLVKIANKLMMGKSLIIFSNLILMAAKGQIYFNVRNLLTEKLSGKEGFVGILDIADDDYRKAKTAEHKRTEKLKHLVSVVTGLTGAIGFPLLLYKIGKSPNKRFTKFKQFMPAFNYRDLVHMPKWVLLSHEIFNWTLPSLLNCRDKNELIERVTSLAAYEFFYLLGDDIISGKAAKHLQNKFKKQLNGFSLISRSKNPFRISSSLSYTDVLELYQKGKAPLLAVKLARKCFWTGILGTTIFLGISSTLLNNYFTKKRVQKEQEQSHQSSL